MKNTIAYFLILSAISMSACSSEEKETTEKAAHQETVDNEAINSLSEQEKDEVLHNEEVTEDLENGLEQIEEKEAELDSALEDLSQINQNN